MGLIEELGAGPVALDTAPFIYFIQEDARFLPVVEPIFHGIDSGRWRAVSSSITLLETLVIPYRVGDLELAERYEALLTRSRGLYLVDLSTPLLRAAAHLRAKLGIKTPDALQLAAALSERCRVFVTNDRRLPELPGLRIISLSTYV